MAEQRKNNYNESSIRVLKGLEPVRQRPGMYTRTENALHILQEVIDNSADEALAGHAKNIHVTLHSDGSVSVADDGRGIPVGKHPDENVSVVEIVFTRLHAGGKFDKTAGGAYAFSGGLHGVGVSVTNALSKRLEVTVWRDGGEYRIVFADGEVIEPLKRTSAAAGRAGTSVRVWPDAKYFDDAAIPAAELARSLKARAVLLPGVITHLANEKTGKSESWRYQGGLKDYLLELVESEPLVVDPWLGEGYVGAGDETFAIGEGAQWAVAWTAEGPTPRESFVNLIPTTAGGTHEAGLREGLFSAVKGFIEQHNLMPKGVKVLPEDVFSRVSFVLSAKVLDPQFQGQTKEKLTSRDALRLVATQVRPPLELWLNRDLESARKIADLAIRAAQHRARSAQKVEKKKGSGVAVLPGKLTDCESTDIARNEIFLVEGDSAGGSAKMGRDKEFQAILPLRGKVLNTWETEPDRLFANAEVHDIAVALGIDPHGISESINWNNLRYGKVCILSDADVDGAHIQVLLLTLFFKHFPQLVQRGHVFVARPPL
ncbi:MAG: DNA topoisomerase IV subunit B, partial [Betaproteobacteria bacterium]